VLTYVALVVLHDAVTSVLVHWMSVHDSL